MRGSCRREATDEVDSDAWGAFCRGEANKEKLPRKKVQTSKFGLHLLLFAMIQQQLAANLVSTYQAACSKTHVG